MDFFFLVDVEVAFVPVSLERLLAFFVFVPPVPLARPHPTALGHDFLAVPLERLVTTLAVLYFYIYACTYACVYTHEDV